MGMPPNTPPRKKGGGGAQFGGAPSQRTLERELEAVRRKVRPSSGENLMLLWGAKTGWLGGVPYSKN